MDVSLKIVTPAATYPVTLAEVKAHAVISTTEDDTLIGSSYIPAATEYAEAYTKRQLVTAKWKLSMDRFPYWGNTNVSRGYAGVNVGGIGWGSGQAIELPLPPLASVTSIIYVDSAGASQTLAASEYQVDIDTEPGRIVPAYGKVWPSVRNDTFNAVQVTFVAGYGVAAAVPPRIKMAMMVLCAHWYKHREIEVTGPPSTNLKHSLDALLLQDRCEPPEYVDV